MIRWSKIRLLLGLSLFWACQKEVSNDPIPKIAYLGHEIVQNELGKDSLILMRFSFEDGDGDLGYTPADTNSPFRIGDPYFYNIHTDFYGVNNGTKVYYIDGFSGDTIRYNQRIASLTPEGKYKALSGTMELRMDFALLLLNGHTPNNVQLEFWINDRNLNQSNRVTSPEIAVNP
ncbi:MAG: hypothetical protein LPK45_07985 [Bacteroidota bacterium]|nr:hypothetical protein [Bacteroidota bacterium]MDX5431010.1 hypothetical protein [Bacteroidota bacterium]MDX5469761.1 hypothetical protein [Bacteroidota bacterium]